MVMRLETSRCLGGQSREMEMRVDPSEGQPVPRGSDVSPPVQRVSR